MLVSAVVFIFSLVLCVAWKSSLKKPGENGSVADSESEGGEGVGQKYHMYPGLASTTTSVYLSDTFNFMKENFEDLTVRGEKSKIALLRGSHGSPGGNDESASHLRVSVLVTVKQWWVQLPVSGPSSPS